MMKAGLKEEVPITDRSALEVLRKELRLAAIALPKLTMLPGGDQALDVELLSTRTTTPLKVVSAEIGKAQTVASQAAPPEPQPANPKPKSSPLPEAGVPAWIGPPAREGGLPNPNLTENPSFVDRFSGRSGSKQTYGVQTLPVGVLSIDFGDVNGDGEDELVAITKNEVLIFKRKGLFFTLEGRVPGSAPDQYLTVGVADINGNGVAEIFVTNADVRKTNTQTITNLRSFVLERRQDRFVPIWEGVPTYLRVLKTPAYPEPLLLVQRPGVDQPFEGPVMRYRWDGQGYVQDPGFPLPPKQAVIFGFTLVDLNGDGQAELVKIGTDGLLRAFDQEGREIAETKEGFGIYPHLTLAFSLNRNEKLDQAAAKHLKAGDLVKHFVIERPLLVTSLGPEGRPGILVGRNVPSGGLAKVVPSLEIIEGGNIVHVAWDGVTLKKQWETDFNKDMYVAGYGLFRLDGDLAMAVLTLDRGFFGTTEATLEVYRLMAQAPNAAAAAKGGESQPAPIVK
jgi:hypothetical protein